jgi:hypothetical protein
MDGMKPLVAQSQDQRLSCQVMKQKQPFPPSLMGRTCNIGSKDVAMYLGAKAASGLVSHAFSKSKVPPPVHGPAFLYAINTAIIFYQSAFEQHNLRSSYWKYVIIHHLIPFLSLIIAMFFLSQIGSYCVLQTVSLFVA